jgi:hypothetical protein
MSCFGNRLTSIINTILNKAVKKWRWIDFKPYIQKFKEPKIRIRWITQDEAARLLMQLPVHLNAMARFTLTTGLSLNMREIDWTRLLSGHSLRACFWLP